MIMQALALVGLAAVIGMLISFTVHLRAKLHKQSIRAKRFLMCAVASQVIGVASCLAAFAYGQYMFVF